MKVYRADIVGESPVIWNRVKKELLDEIHRLKKDEIREWEENEKNWRRKAEYDEKGNVLIPPEWLRGALIEACKQTLIVPHFATSKRQTYTKYTEAMFFKTLAPVCKFDETEYYGMFVGARGVHSATKVWRVRPLLRNWKTIVEIVDPAGRMKKEELQTLLEYSGLMIGIGDGRRINFGRFDVTSLTEVDGIGVLKRKK